MALLLQGVAPVVTAESEHLFYKKANFPEAAHLGLRKRLVAGPHVCQLRETTAV
jgi:hypothetical protein